MKGAQKKKKKAPMLKSREPDPGLKSVINF